jgi:CDGSH-type Zn-finger protein
MNQTRIIPTENGPLQVTGPIELVWPSGHSISITEAATLCRCGASKDKPFCDGTHAKIGFKSVEGDESAHKITEVAP